jgi:hypothetical protein
MAVMAGILRGELSAAGRRGLVMFQTCRLWVSAGGGSRLGGRSLSRWTVHGRPVPLVDSPYLHGICGWPAVRRKPVMAVVAVQLPSCRQRVGAAAGTVAVGVWRRR